MANYNDFRTAVDNVLKHSGYSYHFYELGSKGYGGYNRQVSSNIGNPNNENRFEKKYYVKIRTYKT